MGKVTWDKQHAMKFKKLFDKGETAVSVSQILGIPYATAYYAKVRLSYKKGEIVQLKMNKTTDTYICMGLGVLQRIDPITGKHIKEQVRRKAVVKTAKKRPVKPKQRKPSKPCEPYVQKRTPPKPPPKQMPTLKRNPDDYVMIRVDAKTFKQVHKSKLLTK
jgi:hypothetical protein